MTAAGRGIWRPTLASGLLWGVVVGLLDTLGQPLEDLSFSDLWRFTISVLLQWCIVGLFWAAAARLAERRGQAVIGYFAALPICCAITVLAGSIIRHYVLGNSMGASSWLLTNVRAPDLVAYLAWENAFYGGAYLVGYVAARRSVRLRQRLAEILRARGEADMLLREARLRAYRGQLQPDLMLRALATLRDLSTGDPTAADMLFDRLVTFLRAAMPAVRTGRSTLAAELTTLENYGALRSLIPGEGAALDVRCARPIADLPFPPLILLPALHAIAAGLPPHGQLTLSAYATSERAVLRLSTRPSAGLPFGIGNQLNAALRLAFGNSVSFLTSERGDPLLEIRLLTSTIARDGEASRR